MSASFAARFALIALLSSQTACEASCVKMLVYSAHPCMFREHPPVRERRCIFDCVCLALADVFGPDMFVTDLLGDVDFDVDIGKREYGGKCSRKDRKSSKKKRE
jgi:hypothetical protein